jgi:hypothetical protein
VDQIRQRRQRTHANKRRRSQTWLIRAGRTLEHPGRNLQPAIRVQSAQRAAEDDTIRLRDRLVDRNTHPGPWMPPIQKLPENGTVGVLKPCCITASGLIRALTLERPIAPTSTTCRRSRQHDFFRRRCRVVTPVGLRPPCVPTRQRRTATTAGRGSTYPEPNPVQTKPATSLNKCLENFVLIYH